MEENDRGVEEAAGDRLKHSRGYERGQKFPTIRAFVFVTVCMLLLMCMYCMGVLIYNGLSNINFQQMWFEKGLKVKMSGLKGRQDVLGEVRLSIC